MPGTGRRNASSSGNRISRAPGSGAGATWSATIFLVRASSSGDLRPPQRLPQRIEELPRAGRQHHPPRPPGHAVGALEAPDRPAGDAAHLAIPSWHATPRSRPHRTSSRSAASASSRATRPASRRIRRALRLGAGPTAGGAARRLPASGSSGSPQCASSSRRRATPPPSTPGPRSSAAPARARAAPRSLPRPHGATARRRRPPHHGHQPRRVPRRALPDRRALDERDAPARVAEARRGRHQGAHDARAHHEQILDPIAFARHDHHTEMTSRACRPVFSMLCPTPPSNRNASPAWTSFGAAVHGHHASPLGDEPALPRGVAIHACAALRGDREHGALERDRPRAARRGIELERNTPGSISCPAAAGIRMSQQDIDLNPCVISPSRTAAWATRSPRPRDPRRSAGGR